MSSLAKKPSGSLLLVNHICKQITILLHPYLPSGNRSHDKCAQFFFFFHILLYYCNKCFMTQTAACCNSLTVIRQFSIIILETFCTFDCVWVVASQPGLTPLLTLPFLLLKGFHPLENSAAGRCCFTVYSL